MCVCMYSHSKQDTNNRIDPKRPQRVLSLSILFKMFNFQL